MRLVTGVFVVSALASTPLRAQSDDGARVEKLADGVYAIIHRDATREWPSGATEWPHSNTGVGARPATARPHWRTPR